ncbi:MAG: hypothetical protein GF309_05950 [Candidatus Lokiarchaeota archaeon]|nr:hypothetical protein [Candidatus Lokiarchaeota archaeon]
MGDDLTVAWVFFVTGEAVIGSIGPILCYVLLGPCTLAQLATLPWLEYLFYLALIFGLIYVVLMIYLGTDYRRHEDLRRLNLVIALIPLFTTLGILGYGLNDGLPADLVFGILLNVILFHSLVKAPKFLVPDIPRNAHKCRDPGNSIDKSLLGQAENKLNHKDWKGFYIALAKSIEKALKGIEGSRHRFSLWTRLTMWRRHFGGGLGRDMKTAQEYFNGGKLGMSNSQFKQLWDSAHDVRRNRNKAAHSSGRSVDKKNARRLLRDVRKLVLAIETWRVNHY